MNRIVVDDNQSRQSGSLRLTSSFDETGLQITATSFGTLVNLEGCATTGELGGPALPAKVIRVALPPFTRATEASARPIRSIEVSHHPVFLAPVQLPQPGTKGQAAPPKPDGAGLQPEGREKVVIKPSSLRRPEKPLVEPLAAPLPVPPKAELYKLEATQLRPFARLLTTEEIGLTPVAVVQINPVRLNREGQLEFFPEIEITIFYEGTAGQLAKKADELEVNPTLPISPVIQSRAQAERSFKLATSLVVNPEMVQGFSHLFPLALTPVDYLIITDNHSWNEKTMVPSGTLGDLVATFKRLADWKSKRGLKTKVVTITDIVNGVYGNFKTGARDLQEAIRNFLKWAYSAWGIAWVLLGGDITIIPVRHVPGASEGHIDIQTSDPPPENKSFWTGSYLKMRVAHPGVWFPENSSDHLLVRADNGLFIPYDAAGTSSSTSRGWYFTTDDTYTTRSTTPTDFVRVNGPAAEINGRLQWLYQWNMLATDLYYASLVSTNYNLSGRHDWDLLDNAIYGQHTNDLDFDGVEYRADVSVGRAPISSKSQADGFVDKLIAYEKFQRPDGTSLDHNWPRRLVLISSNWGGRLWLGPTGANPPGDNTFHHTPGQNYSLLKLKDVPTDFKWQLLARISEADLHLLPFDMKAATTGRGWYFAKSSSELAPSEIVIPMPFGGLWHFPMATNWVVVYGTAAELTPTFYIFDRMEQDGSMHDQEQLRQQIAAELPKIDNVSRLYEDEIDLTPAEVAAGLVKHLTADEVHTTLEAGPHFVSLSGHGSPDGCCGLDSSMAQTLHNGYQTFIGYADSCLTNQFDGEDAAGEYLVYNPNGGAVAYIGNSRFSWIGVGDNFQRAFFHRLTSTSHLGLLNDIRCNMVNEATGFWQLYNKWEIFSLNLMGDPEMPVWIGSPMIMKVNFEKTLDQRQPFTVQVSRTSGFTYLPLAGALVHLQQGAFAQLAFTDVAGKATFSLSAAHLGDLEVTVTKLGYQPYCGTARIVGPAWVSGTVIFIDHQHGSPYQTLVRLQLDPPIDGDTDRGWYVLSSKPDYIPILDAVTDAYISQKKIALYVNKTNEGGTIERFRFGEWRPLLKLPDLGEVVVQLNGHKLSEVVVEALVEPELVKN